MGWLDKVVTRRAAAEEIALLGAAGTLSSAGLSMFAAGDAQADELQKSLDKAYVDSQKKFSFNATGSTEDRPSVLRQQASAYLETIASGKDLAAVMSLEPNISGINSLQLVQETLTTSLAALRVQAKGEAYTFNRAIEAYAATLLSSAKLIAIGNAIQEGDPRKKIREDILSSLTRLHIDLIGLERAFLAALNTRS